MKALRPPFFERLKIRPASPDRTRSSGFTLVELMVASAVLAMMVGLVFVIISQMAGGIKNSSAKLDAFQSARTGFEAVSRTLGVATLNTYWDYFDTNRTSRGASTNFTPAFYGRQSDLHFLITQPPYSTPASLDPIGHSLFFQAPLGYFADTTAANPPGGLNPCGFFVAFGNDPTKPGLTELEEKPRFRLFQWLPSSESLIVESSTGRLTDASWVAPTNGVRPLADNIIAFVVRVPSISAGVYSSDATDYGWDSHTSWPIAGVQPSQMNQLPPLVNITMVAIEEAAAKRLTGTATDAASAASALGISNLSALFTTPSQYDDDLETIRTALASKHIPYRIFTTTVPLRGSRWSP